MGLKRTKIRRVGQTQELVAGVSLFALGFRRREDATQAFN